MLKISNAYLLKLVVLPFLGIFILASCKKSSNPPATVYSSKDYKLYNVSSGTSIEAGTFTIGELANGNARVVINLNPGYRVAGVTLKANITVIDLTGAELVYADLGDVNGTSGFGEKNPVLVSSTSSAVKYTDLIAKTGYRVKVLNGSNVQGIGTIN